MNALSLAKPSREGRAERLNSLPNGWEVNLNPGFTANLTVRTMATVLLAACATLSSDLTRAECAADEPVLIFLVRHAEKLTSGEDPALSDAGQLRAEQLASLLQDAGIEYVYSTAFARTRDTAAPLAGRLGLPLTLYDWDEMDALVAELKTAGRRSLVVGHSDTTPELVGLLGGDPGPPIDEQAEYDRLYLVTIAVDGSTQTELRRYGPP